jgi:hypothetical protein
MKRNRQSFKEIMDRLSARHGVHQIFSDFLTLLICAFSHGKMEGLYLETINRYEKPEAYDFSEALASLVIEMTGDGSGMVDVLGTYFEENVSHGRNGQFFTPKQICDLLARMNKPDRFGSRILDPACGSGRMLLAMGKLNRFALFYGADVDANCAKMTVINLCLNGLFGEVAWMNSLTNEFYGAWEIMPTVKGIPRIREITSRESYIHLKLPSEKEKVVRVPEQTSFVL